MVGLYESTIDVFMSFIGGRPAKIIASTATICRATEQVHSLYAREIFLFPPQGLRVEIHIFALEAKSERDDSPVPGRMYVGVFARPFFMMCDCPSGAVMSALLQAVKCVNVTNPDALGSLLTLMAYFNSRVNFNTRLIRADIREHLNAVWDRTNIRNLYKDPVILIYEDLSTGILNSRSHSK